MIPGYYPAQQPDDRTYTLAEWLAKELAAAREREATLREALKEIANGFDDDDASDRAKYIARAALAASPAAEELREHADARIARVNEEWGKVAEEPQP